MLPQPPSASAGWPLLEALERTADPAAWDAYTKARVAFDEARRRNPSSPGELLENTCELEHRSKATLDTVFNSLKLDLWKLVAEERLFARGSRGEPGIPPTPVAALGWSNLLVHQWEQSRMFERSEPRVSIHNIRLFPLVYDPEAPTRLAGLTLAEAFRECVLEDPEVVSRGKRAPELSYDSAVLRDGKYPGVTVSYRWPLDLETKNLAFHLLHRGVYFSHSEIKQPSSDLLKALDVFSSRFQKLRDLLSRGDLVARGTFAATGIEQDISAAQWRRSEMQIDVRNSDLFDKAGYKADPTWTGIVVRAAAAAGPTVLLATEAGRPSDRRKSVSLVKTRASSQTECTRWLEAEMRRQPLQRVGTKGCWWEQARKRWPNSLSHNAFNHAWATAIRNANAHAWAASGAPRKSSK